MLQIETSQIFDATKYLGCSTCPLNHNCNKYMLICDFVKSKNYFGACTLCLIELAENACMRLQNELLKNKVSNVAERVKTLYKRFLPALNADLQAFYKYECEDAGEYTKNALIFAVAESLEYHELLQYFDFFFSQDIENTRDILQKSFEYEITKSENQKLAAEKCNENNTTN